MRKKERDKALKRRRKTYFWAKEYHSSIRFRIVNASSGGKNFIAAARRSRGIWKSSNCLSPSPISCFFLRSRQVTPNFEDRLYQCSIILSPLPKFLRNLYRWRERERERDEWSFSRLSKVRSNLFFFREKDDMFACLSLTIFVNKRGDL